MTTKEEAIASINDNLVYYQTDFETQLVNASLARLVIQQIFNDHEAQLKAKDEEIEVLHSHLKTIDEDYSALASDFESAVMKIDRLKDTK